MGIPPAAMAPAVTIIWITSIVGAYLVGSIPVGVLLGRARGIDIRLHGSRNVGATNVARVLGRKTGLLCFALDVAKGALPVIAAGAAAGVLGRPAAARSASAAPPLSQAEVWLWMAVAMSAVAGHMLPVFLRFRGGKGVATGFGAMAAMWPVLTLAALGALAVWCAVLKLTRYVSVASMVAAGSLPLGYAASIAAPAAVGDSTEGAILELCRAWPPLAVTAAMALLVVYRHRANIGRLRRGEEPRVGAARA